MIHKILELHGLAAYAIIFALPALEASVFLGFLFPGEIAVLLGGVLAFQGRISLPGAIAAAVAGAVIGDSVGYAVGKRYGTRLLTGPLRRLVKEHHRTVAIEFLQRHRGKAVFLGRFTAALRVLVPGFAGMAGIHYPTFLLYNVIGGVAWAGGFTIVGYLAGNGYRRVEHVLGRASLVLLGLVVFVGIVVLTARWIARHPERFAGFRERLLARPVVRFVVRPFAFVLARFKPGEAYGLALTAGALTAAVFGVAFGFLVRRVVGRQTLEFIDLPVLHALMRRASSGFTTFMRIFTQLGGVIAALVIGIAVAILLARRRRWTSIVLLAASPIGAGLLEIVVKDVVRRPRPPVPHLIYAAGYGFPSGHAVRSVTLFFALALVGSRLVAWRWKVSLWAGAVVLAGGIGFSRVYLRVHYVTDVLGGYALAGLWLALVVSVVGAWTRARDSRIAAATPSQPS